MPCIDGAPAGEWPVVPSGAADGIELSLAPCPRFPEPGGAVQWRVVRITVSAR